MVAEVLETAGAVRFSPKLRERCFGRLEGRTHREARTLCAHTPMGPDAKPYGTESVVELFARLTRVTAALESMYTNEAILLVSHSSPLQVLGAAFARLGPAEYQRVSSLGFAEIRELAFGELPR